MNKGIKVLVIIIITFVFVLADYYVKPQTPFVVLFFWFSAVFSFLFFFGRYQRAMELKESQETLLAVIESASDAIIMMDNAGKIELWNQAAVFMFGYNFDEVKNKNILAFITPATSFGLRDIFSTKQKIVTNQVFEAEATNKQGRIFPVELSISTTNIHGHRHILGIVRDISESKNNETVLLNQSKELDDSRQAILNVLEDVEAEKAQTQALLSAVGDGVISVDRDKRITFMNQSAANMLKVDITDIVGKIYYKFLKVEDHRSRPVKVKDRPFSIAISHSKSVTTSVAMPYYYYRHDGSKFPVAISVSPVVMNGATIGAIDVFRDITHEIEVDKMKTEFISLASHQLRTPLSATKWFADMLLRGDAGKLHGEQTEFVKNIYDSNERMIELVNSLLNISRIESGRLIVNPTPSNLSDLVNDVVKDLRTKLDQKQQKLTISISSGLPAINLDRSLVRQAYLNLLTNAIKYTPKDGKINIDISLEKDHVVTQVSDSGYGIPAADSRKVFQKFFRSENILSYETDGTGLGLYLTKAIIESSGGKIWFKSTQNKGTTFWFTLPIKGVAPISGEVALNN